MRSCFLPAVFIALTACARSTTVVQPQEPRQLDASVEDRIRDHAAETPEDCDPEQLEVYLAEGKRERATYVVVGCDVVYRYEARCDRPEHNGHVGPWRCSIDGGEEVDTDEVDEVLAEANENDLDGALASEADED